MVRLTCRCMGLSSRRVSELVLARGLGDVEAIGQVCGAGTGCGTCRPELEEILADARGEPVLDRTRRANRERNTAEAFRRVETALFGSIAARLPPAARLELVSVDGLRVELHAAAGDGPELRALVAERLAKLVCVELEVVFR